MLGWARIGKAKWVHSSIFFFFLKTCMWVCVAKWCSSVYKVFLYDFIEKCDEFECTNYKVYMCGDWNVKSGYYLSPCICFPCYHNCSFCSFPMFVCGCVFSLKNQVIENNVRLVYLRQQPKIPKKWKEILVYSFSYVVTPFLLLLLYVSCWSWLCAYDRKTMENNVSIIN